MRTQVTISLQSKNSPAAISVYDKHHKRPPTKKFSAQSCVLWIPIWKDTHYAPKALSSPNSVILLLSVSEMNRRSWRTTANVAHYTVLCEELLDTYRQSKSDRLKFTLDNVSKSMLRSTRGLEGSAPTHTRHICGNIARFSKILAIASRVKIPGFTSNCNDE